MALAESMETAAFSWMKRGGAEPHKTAPAAARPAVADTRRPAPAEMTLGQYLRHLDDLMLRETRDAVMQAVVRVPPQEIEALIRKTTKLRGRYLALLLERRLATPLVGAFEAEELRKARKRYEEFDRGIAALREAISAGIVEVSGLKRQSY
ncbi:MAG: hypothetical protein ACREDZ_01750 [Kiloniellales bacterium]